MDMLGTVARIASSGMAAQSHRLRVVSENLANATSTGTDPGTDPYRRKTIVFGELVGRGGDAHGGVEVVRVGRDRGDFVLRHDPSHPAANAEGYVKMPNVAPLVEMANMREAARGYEANLTLFESARRMRGQLIDLLR